MSLSASVISGIKPRRYRLLCFKIKSRQAGQAMPLGIAAILVGFVGAFMLFNTGQVAVDKQRLSDASDSAAYSGMVWQARAMNFQAYTNRAMIANDVSIGQAVSLNSWSNYAAVATGNLETAFGAIPVLNVVVSVIAQVMGVVNTVITTITDVMVDIVDTVNGVISVAQEGMFYSAFIATPDIVKSVADASDKRFSADSLYGVGGLAANLEQWNSFTSKYEHDNWDAMVERTDLISDSREAFATDRKWKFVSGFWVYTTPLARHRLYYEGETRLMMKDAQNADPQWEWVAKDTMSLHTKTITFKRWRIKTANLELPIGWAASYAKEDSSRSDAINNCSDYNTKDADPCEFIKKNDLGEDFADTGFPGISTTRSLSDEPYPYGPYALDGYTGVREFRSLSTDSIEDEDLDPTLRLRAEVMMDLDDSSSNSWVAEDSRFSSELAGAADKISSISIGEVYYRHPKAYGSSKGEIASQRANGYNPYWDVRLVPVELTERLIALGLRGDPGSSASTPGLAGYPENDEDPDLEVGGNIDTDLVVDALPEYASTLATAMGYDDSDVAQAITDFIPGGAGAVANFETVAAVYETAVGGDIRGQLETALKDTLKQELEDAAKNIIGDWIEGTLGVSATEQQEIVGQVATAEMEARDFIEKMEDIQEQVGDDFEAALEEHVGAFEVQIQPYEQAITTAFQEYDQIRSTSFNEDRITAARTTYYGIRATQNNLISTAAGVLRETIMTSVLDSVSRARC